MCQHINELNYFKTVHFFVECKGVQRNTDVICKEVPYTYRERILVQLLSFRSFHPSVVRCKFKQVSVIWYFIILSECSKHEIIQRNFAAYAISDYTFTGACDANYVDVILKPIYETFRRPTLLLCSLLIFFLNPLLLHY